jgi:hypothetical protein
MGEMIIEVTHQELFDILTAKRRLLLPDGAKIRKAWNEVRYTHSFLVSEMSLFLRVEHESYREVPLGGRLRTVRARLAIDKKQPYRQQTPARLAAAGR